MIVGITFISCSLLYSIMLTVVYYRKQRINSIENKIYSILVRMNVFGLILELLCSYFVFVIGTSPINNLFAFLGVNICTIYIFRVFLE